MFLYADRLDTTIAVNWDVNGKTSNQTNYYARASPKCKTLKERDMMNFGKF